MNPGVVFVPLRSFLSGLVVDVAELLHDVPDPLLRLGCDRGRIGDAQDQRRGGVVGNLGLPRHIGERWRSAPEADRVCSRPAR